MKDVDAWIPCSGMLVANMLTLKLSLPLADLDCFFDSRAC